MAQNFTGGCLQKLRAECANLNPATKKVAEYILENPGDIIECNIADLAERIQVSPYSIISCIKTIGYSGYKDFRIAFAQSYDPAQTTLFEGITSEDSPFTIFQKTIQKKRNSLSETEKIVDPKTIGQAVDMIVASQRIEFYGIGYSKYAAEMLCMSLRRIGRNTVFYSDPNFQQMSAFMLGEQDLAIGFSTSGVTQSVVKALKYAKIGGCKTIVVTSIPRSPITEYADVTLLTTYSDPLLIKDTVSSSIEQIALVSSLLLAVAHIDAPHALVNLSETSAVIGDSQSRRHFQESSVSNENSDPNAIF